MESILALDAVSSGISAAIIKDGELICDLTIDNKKTHSQGLMKLMDFALKMADLKIADIDKIITTNGPGSFTGLRILLSTVKGLAHNHNIPIYSVSSLRALANHDLHFKGLLCPIMDARRKQVYNAVYDEEGSEVFAEDTRMIEDLLDQLAQRAKSDQKSVLFVGDGIAKYREQILAGSEFFEVGDLKHATNPALCAYRAYLKGHCKLNHYDDLDVNYLRVPEAQRNLESETKG